MRDYKSELDQIKVDMCREINSLLDDRAIHMNHMTIQRVDGVIMITHNDESKNSLMVTTVTIIIAILDHLRSLSNIGIDVSTMEKPTGLYSSLVCSTSAAAKNYRINNEKSAAITMAANAGIVNPVPEFTVSTTTGLSYVVIVDDSSGKFVVINNNSDMSTDDALSDFLSISGGTAALFFTSDDGNYEIYSHIEKDDV